jgi:septal ring factor EnvC (AmiA/AmiB activator)
MTPEERWELIEGWILKHEERHDRLEAEMAVEEKRHKKAMADLDAYLRHAVRLGIREARAERAKRREVMAELDDKITKIAAAQLENQQGLKELQASMRAFLDWMRRGNGHQPNF